MKGWVARDKDERIHFYEHKPWKNADGINDEWSPRVLKNEIGRMIQCPRVYEGGLSKGVNPQWSDDEPIQVELNRCVW